MGYAILPKIQIFFCETNNSTWVFFEKLFKNFSRESEPNFHKSVALSRNYGETASGILGIIFLLHAAILRIS